MIQEGAVPVRDHAYADALLTAISIIEAVRREDHQGVETLLHGEGNPLRTVECLASLFLSLADGQPDEGSLLLNGFRELAIQARAST